MRESRSVERGHGQLHNKRAKCLGKLHIHKCESSGCHDRFTGSRL